MLPFRVSRPRGNRGCITESPSRLSISVERECANVCRDGRPCSGFRWVSNGDPRSRHPCDTARVVDPRPEHGHTHHRAIYRERQRGLGVRRPDERQVEAPCRQRPADGRAPREPHRGGNEPLVSTESLERGHWLENAHEEVSGAVADA